MSGSAREAPPSGRIENGVHLFPVRVYYEDTDAAGIVYHANYLRFAERGRTEYLRVIGASHRAMRAETGAAYAVRRCAIEFMAPARLDDALEVRTRMLAVSGASLRAEQTIRRGGEDLVRIELLIACIAPSGRPTRLPPSVRSALAAHLEASSVEESGSETHGG